MSIDCRVASAVVLLGSLALVPSARAGDPPLFPCQELTFEGDGDGAAHADWNGDGNLDVAITGLPSTGAHNFKGVTLFFGDGLGNFPTKITRTLPTYSRDVAAADVDGDGRPDLVTLYGAGGGPGGIEVAKNGPLGLGAGSNYVVDEFPTNLAAGDVTNDGRPDLVCSTGGLAIVDVLVNDGTGAFPTLIQKTGVVGCKGIALDDFDQNGDLDFAVTQFNTGTLETTYYGDGAGAFPRKRSVTSPNVDHSSLCAGDFNADGFPDVAVGDGNGSNLFELRVLINNGLSGTTNGFASMAILSDTSRIYCVRTDDIDFDGKLDLVVESDGIEVRRGLGGGAFDAPTRDDPVSIYKGGFTLADFDTDGDLDLAGGGRYDAIVMLGRPGGRFQGGEVARYTGGDIPSDLELADFTGDGMPDLALALGGLPPVIASNAVAIFTNDGAGGLGQTSTLAVGPAPAGLDSGDLDHDSDLDLVVACAGVSGLDVSLGDGHGAFASPSVATVPSPPDAVALGDLDHDGNLDAVASLPTPKRAAVLRGLGNGSFAPSVEFPSGAGAFGLTLVDLDQDGDLDVACALQSSSQVAVLTNGGAGALSAPQFLDVDAGPTQTAAADLDGNGFQDVIAACGVAKGVTVLPNLGGGNFAAPIHLGSDAVNDLGQDDMGLAVRDLDGDGDADVVMSEAYPEHFVVFENRGALAFAAKSYAAHIAPLDCDVADLDSDGKPDVVTADQLHTVSIARNVGREPVGLTVYGHGTPGCFGPQWLLGNGSPTIGNSAFRLRAGRGMPNTPTWLLIATQPDFAGTGAVLVFHVQLASIALVTALPNDASGELVLPAPIPPVPAYAGVTAYVQALPYWPNGPCLPSGFRVSSTPGLEIVLQP